MFVTLWADESQNILETTQNSVKVPYLKVFKNTFNIILGS